MKKEKLFELVRQEAANLKLHATKEEIERLDINNLIPDNSHECIYGQMTGYCFSDRAHDLIVACCERVYEPVESDDGDLMKKAKLNGAPQKLKRDHFKKEYFSPIEIMIVVHPKNNERLIQYLKGETETLELT